MRKIIVLLLLPLCVSCMSVKFKSFEAVEFWDYSTLTEKGFFVTESNSVSFEYTAVGSVYIEIRAGEDKSQTKYVNKEARLDSDIYRPSKEKVIVYTSATITDALNKLSNQLTNVGANGIINLKITQVSSMQVSNDTYYGPGYIITGMAIRR